MWDDPDFGEGKPRLVNRLFWPTINLRPWLSSREAVAIQNSEIRKGAASNPAFFPARSSLCLKGPSRTLAWWVRNHSVSSATLGGETLKAHTVRNCVVIINVKHTPLHAGDFVAVVGAPVS